MQTTEYTEHTENDEAGIAMSDVRKVSFNIMMMISAFSVVSHLPF